MTDRPAVDPRWLAGLQAAAARPPLRPRVPLVAGSSVIGSVEPDFFNKKAFQAILNGRKQLLKEEHSGSLSWRLMGDVTSSLHVVALAMQAAGLAGAWRSEQLAVHDHFGQRKGSIERAAVRPLGISTLAVHLVGMAPDGRVWVQQRALDKSVDPGLWDTLVGGMVPAAETLDSALARETWEEAGLRIADVQQLRYAGRLANSRPCLDGQGTGYMVETLECYVCTVPKALQPVNQDGEVAQFRLMTPGELTKALQHDAFTVDAALILVDALGLAGAGDLARANTHP